MRLSTIDDCSTAHEPIGFLFHGRIVLQARWSRNTRSTSISLPQFDNSFGDRLCAFGKLDRLPLLILEIDLAQQLLLFFLGQFRVGEHLFDALPVQIQEGAVIGLG
jgi:hypothetical protein